MHHIRFLGGGKGCFSSNLFSFRHLCLAWYRCGVAFFFSLVSFCFFIYSFYLYLDARGGGWGCIYGTDGRNIERYNYMHIYIYTYINVTHRPPIDLSSHIHASPYPLRYSVVVFKIFLYGLNQSLGNGSLTSLAFPKLSKLAHGLHNGGVCVIVIFILPHAARGAMAEAPLLLPNQQRCPGPTLASRHFAPRCPAVIVGPLISSIPTCTIVWGGQRSIPVASGQYFNLNCVHGGDSCIPPTCLLHQL